MSRNDEINQLQGQRLSQFSHVHRTEDKKKRKTNLCDEFLLKDVEMKDMEWLEYRENILSNSERSVCRIKAQERTELKKIAKYATTKYKVFITNSEENQDLDNKISKS